MKTLLPRSLATAAMLIAVGCTQVIDDRILAGARRFDAVEGAGLNSTAEDGAELHSGKLLIERGDWTLEFNINGDRTTLSRNGEDFIEARIESGVISAPYGEIPTVLVEAVEPPGDRARPLIVRCYGNGATVYNNGAAAALAALPYADIQQFDYPGFDDPQANGTRDLRTLENLEAMATAIAADFNERTVKRPLIFWGHSMGGVVCADIASRVAAADGLVLETTANDVLSIGNAIVPWFAKPVIRLKIAPGFARYDVAKTLADFDAPVLILGAGGDKVLPVRLSRSLNEKLSASKLDVQYHEFPDASHYSAPFQPGFDQAFRAFLIAAAAHEEIKNNPPDGL